MKCLLFLPILLLISISGLPQSIDPTGTYTLAGTVKKNKVISHSGEIRAMLLPDNRVALSFYMNKGYPGYESGSFLDTLNYDEDNIARYIPSADSTCTILFLFTMRTAVISQLYSNPHSGCGFTFGVLIPQTFQKTSDNRPVMQDFSTRGKP